MTSKQKCIVMFGVDSERKARAAKFAATEEGSVRKAAGLMGYRVGVPKSEEAIRVATALPDGKLFDSGVGMAPLVREETFYRLLEILSFDSNWLSHGIITGNKASTDTATVKAANELWGAIKVGSTVLAFDTADPSIFGWSAAIVLAISKNGEELELRWRDWPGFKAFMVERRTIALLRPDICA